MLLLLLRTKWSGGFARSSMCSNLFFRFVNIGFFGHFFCVCKVSNKAQSMRQNAQQHDTEINPLVLQMLLPLHCLHLLLSGWCLQMLSVMPPHSSFLLRLLCHWCSQMFKFLLLQALNSLLCRY